MNINIQCCGIVIIILLLYFFIRQKKIKLRTGTVYLSALIITLVSVSLDVLSIVALSHRENIPEIFIVLVLKLYLISLLSIGLIGILYVCADIYKDNKTFMGCVFQLVIYSGIMCVGIILLPLYFNTNNTNAIYTEGPAVLVTYIGNASFIIMTLIALRVNKDVLNHDRYVAVNILEIVWLVSAVIQFMNNRLLIVGFASCIGLMIVYIKLENPGNNIDRKTEMFNQTAMTCYLDQCYFDNAQKCILFLQWDDSGSTNMNQHEVFLHRKDNLKMFKDIKGVTIFRYTEEDVVFVFNTQESAEQTKQLIVDKVELMRKKFSNYVCHYELIYFPNSLVVGKLDELLKITRYVKKSYLNKPNNNVINVNNVILDKINHEREIEHLVESAIENEDMVEVYYQPIYSVRYKQYTSAEALVRIKDDKGKIISPGEFIEIAERNGSIVPLGRIVFKKVCRYISGDRGKHPTLKYIEVNLSVVQCSDEMLADEFISIMKEYGINPNLINLEITESSITKDREVLIKNMDKLRAFGVKFSLDDFGTGASNLSYMVDMPVDIIKFDREMTMSYFNNNKARYVMEAAMLMIRGLELEIVAEGIEEQQHYDIMEQLNIDYIQGFFFSKPLPLEEFCKFLEQQQITG